MRRTTEEELAELSEASIFINGQLVLHATRNGWAIPGGGEIRSERYARVYARRLHEIIASAEGCSGEE